TVCRSRLANNISHGLVGLGSVNSWTSRPLTSQRRLPGSTWTVKRLKLSRCRALPGRLICSWLPTGHHRLTEVGFGSNTMPAWPLGPSHQPAGYTSTENSNVTVSG